MGATLDSYGPIGQYLPVFIIGVIAVVLGLLLVNLSKLMGPFRPNKVKQSVYESGMDPVGTGHDRISVKFFMVAMLFILFDNSTINLFLGKKMMLFLILFVCVGMCVIMHPADAESMNAVFKAGGCTGGRRRKEDIY